MSGVELVGFVAALFGCFWGLGPGVFSCLVVWYKIVVGINIDRPLRKKDHNAAVWSRDPGGESSEKLVFIVATPFFFFW